MSKELFQTLVNHAQEGVWIENDQAKITFVNPALCKILGRTNDEMIGHRITEYVDPTNSSRVFDEKPLQNNPFECCFLDSAGSPAWGMISLVQLDDPAGEEYRAGLVMDITESKRIEQARLESENPYRDLFENTPFSLWEEDFSEIKAELDKLHAQGITDLPGYIESNPDFLPFCMDKLVIRNVNLATLELYQAKTKEELFANMSVVINDPYNKIFQLGLVEIFAGRTSFETEGINFRLDGQPVQIILKWTVLPGYETSLKKIIVSIFDKTALYQAQEKLIAAEARYRMLVEQVSAVIYTDLTDETSTTFYISPQVESLTGYSADEWLNTPDLWAKTVFIEDWERVQKENRRTNKTKEPFQMEYRLVRKDGQTVWVLDQAVMVWDQNLKSWVWQGVWIDINDRKRVEEALQESEARLRLLLQSQGEGTILFNLEGSLIFANTAAEKLFAIGSLPVTTFTLADFMNGEQAKALLQKVQELKPGENTTLELDITPPEGGRRWLLVTLSPWFETQQQLAGGLAVCRDNTSRRKTERELQFQSTHDPLTGLYNRWYFEKQMVSFTHNQFFPISLVMVDIDGLKRINDLLGHQVGDIMLCRTAQVLMLVFRAEDVVARIGGDEFAVLLPNTDKENVDKIISRISQHLEKVKQNQPDQQLSLSLGAYTAENEHELSTAFHRADQAMYREKKSKHSSSSAQSGS